MKIAIFGATSEIAKDLIQSFTAHDEHELLLFARRPKEVEQWLEVVGLSKRCKFFDFYEFSENLKINVIINFVGVGDPAKTILMGASIFDITYHYDTIALAYLQKHQDCKYIFLSSGAVYGSNFEEPANCRTPSFLLLNNLQPEDYYGIAKLYAECRHRAAKDSAIVDIRVFNYYSRTQTVNSRFLIFDIARAVRDQSTLETDGINIVRDYLHPQDLYQLVNKILLSESKNISIDCYTRKAISK